MDGKKYFENIGATNVGIVAPVVSACREFFKRHDKYIIHADAAGEKFAIREFSDHYVYHVQFRDDCGSKFAVINIKQPLCITLINLMEIS
jgi:hypothetical protein